MGAFDKIKSGLLGMDELLNYIRMVHKSDDGQLFPRDMPLSVPAGHGGIFPAAAGQTFFRGGCAHQGYHPASPGCVSGRPDLSPSSESVESLFDKDVPPSFVQSSAGGRISV